ncbi:1-deoxy-D-xylulose-5-phosphate synthase [Luminiphilus sp.]|jgi:1-deoxy-D-xylulose-5-phosphate synthase|nr:1-deoxy-D-xylulose-5-phosphate synthase [Luminiphilus sp.]MDA8591286.1 1-deoxy-D-xylulose-5-phosphate synthase [Luminiphilus sp.]MDA8738954.1 1-deoxy-D-xylulose-5-phosphate synthase [Luminiphilus sp.]MDB3899681.1 1-deoxy-D-xylulose-5-phosphate synthase [Luminiphilus sp.]
MNFDQLPTTAPETPVLDRIADAGHEIASLNDEELVRLANELREFLLYSVSTTGGHFGAGLGVVELTIALHHVFNTPDDRIVWDVGHQCYPHKVLTGRRERMSSMRHKGGLSGFPKRSESEYDTFGVGHSSTSISAAMGMALAARQQGIDRKVVAIIGDGAITGGMAFEALAHAGHERPNMLVILNDNQMSIGHNTGGLAKYFARIWASQNYLTLRETSKKLLEHVKPAWELAKRTEEHMKGMVTPGTLFEELGWHYIGPLDGHDLPSLAKVLKRVSSLDGPQILHIRTIKGKGFAPAEADPIGYHALGKLETKKPESSSSEPKPPKYQDVFGQWLCDTAAEDSRLAGITPAMGEGSGMVNFAASYPDRYFDVAIAEQHAVTLAAGMACDGVKPVVAIYSTFLQRGYDQLIHDVALQNLDVTFAIDRAGLVGQDGATHHGAFDLSYLRCIPNLIIAAPSNENDCRQMLVSAYNHPGPSAVRYPRGEGTGVRIEPQLRGVEIGKGHVVREGSEIAILNFGVLLTEAEKAGEALNATVADMRWVKPLDTDLIMQLAQTHSRFITVEENVVAGGAGSGVAEYLASQGLNIEIRHVAIDDRFIDHASQGETRIDAGLSCDDILEQANLGHAKLNGTKTAVAL